MKVAGQKCPMPAACWRHASNKYAVGPLCHMTLSGYLPPLMCSQLLFKLKGSCCASIFILFYCLWRRLTATSLLHMLSKGFIFESCSSPWLLVASGWTTLQVLWDMTARPGSPDWLVQEVALTRKGLLQLRQNLLLVRHPDDPEVSSGLEGVEGDGRTWYVVASAIW